MKIPTFPRAKLWIAELVPTRWALVRFTKTQYHSIDVHYSKLIIWDVAAIFAPSLFKIESIFFSFFLFPDRMKCTFSLLFSENVTIGRLPMDNLPCLLIWILVLITRFVCSYMRFILEFWRCSRLCWKPIISLGSSRPLLSRLQNDTGQESFA